MFCPNRAVPTVQQACGRQLQSASRPVPTRLLGSSVSIRRRRQLERQKASSSAVSCLLTTIRHAAAESHAVIWRKCLEWRIGRCCLRMRLAPRDTHSRISGPRPFPRRAVLPFIISTTACETLGPPASARHITSPYDPNERHFFSKPARRLRNRESVLRQMTKPTLEI
jgi:hypothetical protein